MSPCTRGGGQCRKSREKWQRKHDWHLQMMSALHFWSQDFRFLYFQTQMNSAPSPVFFPPVAIKTRRAASSVVHHHALGHIISIPGRHTFSLYWGALPLKWGRWNYRFMWSRSKRNRSLCTVKIKWFLRFYSSGDKRIKKWLLRYFDYFETWTKKYKNFMVGDRCMLYIVLAICSTFTTISRVLGLLFFFNNGGIYFSWVVFRSRCGDVILHWLQSWTFGQRDPTTNAQDKSSSVVVARHFWFPAALRCDLLDAPLALWWWRNRSCTFSSLREGRGGKKREKDNDASWNRDRCFHCLWKTGFCSWQFLSKPYIPFYLSFSKLKVITRLRLKKML